MRPVLAYFRIALMMLFLAIGMSYLIVRTKVFGRSEAVGFRMRRWYCRCSHWILGIRLEVTGKYLNKNALYISNHRSFSDPLILLHILNTYVISKKEVRNIPLLGYGASLTGTLFVDRKDPDSRSAVKETIADVLRDGKQILIFPEGTTNVKMFSSKFKKGSIEKAIELQVPIVPITVEYRDRKDYWSNKSMRQHFIDQYGRWRTHCSVQIHEPFVSQDLNSALRRIQISIDGGIAAYHSYDDHSPRPL